MVQGKANHKKRPVLIREMEIDDLAEVYNLGESTFRSDLWPMLYRSWDVYEVTTLFNTDGEYCLVAENDSDNPDPGERIVGFILGTVVNKPGSAWSYGYIIWLCSHPNWSREGVASRLMDELIELMIENDGIRIVMADTDPKNTKAMKFFSKRGLNSIKAHVYLTSNLEQNPRYKSLIKAQRKVKGPGVDSRPLEDENQSPADSVPPDPGEVLAKPPSRKGRARPKASSQRYRAQSAQSDS